MAAGDAPHSGWGRPGDRRADQRRRPGADAATPLEVPGAGWRQILVRAWQHGSQHNIPILAGGVAFFGFLAIFPALIAALTIYGLVADPTQVRTLIQGFASTLPQAAQQLITDQLTSVANSSTGALTAGLVISVLFALFSASSGTQNLMVAVNLAYDETEGRGAIKLRATALVLTVGTIVFVLLTIGLLAVLPAVLGTLGLGPVVRVFTQIGQWLLLVGLVIVGLAVVYRVAPDRHPPRFSWISPGTLAASLLWILGSVVFSLYVTFFGSFNATYGALAGVIVLLLWFYLSSFLVLLGAEINAESERQTVRDTTRGEPEPMGRRGATAADTAPDT